jgi:hypothetical protein
MENVMDKLKVVHLYKSFDVYNGLMEILTIMAQNIDHNAYELGACVFEYGGNEFGDAFCDLGGKIFNLGVPQKTINEPQSFIKLYTFLKTYKPHVVQTHVLKANLLGTLAARLAKVPVVIATEMTLKDTAPSWLKRVRDTCMQPFTLYMLERCDKFVTTSHYIKQEWYPNRDNDLVEVVYPPFNLKKCTSAQKKKEKNYHCISMGTL